MKELLKDLERRMTSAVDVLKGELSRLRTGRASLALLDGIHVDYYGSPAPLNQVASLTVPEPTTIVIAPWEPRLLVDIEKAILRSQLGLNPVNDGKVIRLRIPALTEERRRELVRVAHGFAEQARNAIRQIRRDGNERIKKMERAGEVSEDEMHDRQAEVQRLTDSHIAQVEDVLGRKEKEILEG